MDTNKILKILPDLSNCDRLLIAKEALRLIHLDRDNLTEEEIEQHWQVAAAEALDDYSTDSELTAFEVLDCEFHHEDGDGK